MINTFKKNIHLVGLIIIIVGAIFVRGWMFSDLLTFKMDQSRDIKLVEDAYRAGNGRITMEGLGELPLLGPRAAKTYLRLGPISYYFEYVALLIFGDKPWAMAVPDFIFSILTIPLFYYFLRQTFSKKVSLMTTAVFASSFFLTQYSRFAWNPNSIPFWSLVYFLGLYKIVHGSQPKMHSSGRWLLVLIIGYSVASQLHFTAMLAYPIIGVLFIFGSWIIKRGRTSHSKRSANNFKFKILNFNSIFNNLIFNFKNRKSRKGEENSKKQLVDDSNFKQDSIFQIPKRYWLGAVIILGIMYLPMILSELYTQGDNWLQFKYALGGRGKEEFSLYAKIVQSIRLHSEYFWFTLTSISGGGGNFGVFGLLGTIFFFGWIFLKEIILNFKFNTPGSPPSLRNSKFKIQPQVMRQDKNSNWLFFLLIWIWFGVMFLLYTKLAFNVLKPRYWLLEVPVFFVFIALAFQWLSHFKNIIQKSSYILVSILVIINLWAAGSWYRIVQKQEGNGMLSWDLKLKDKNMIPWGQLKKSADYVETLSSQTNKSICFYATGEYRPVYDYIFEHRGMSERIRRMSFKNDSNENCLFITIDHHRHRELPRIPSDHQDEFEKVINGRKEIGFVTIWQVTRNEQDKNLQVKKSINLNEEKNKSFIDRGKLVDVTIEDNIVGTKIDPKSSGEKKVNLSNINQKKHKKPKRVERVRWKDIVAKINKII